MTAPDAEVTTIRLPHTGLRVPDRSLSVTALKQLQTSGGVAYTANLRVNSRIVGLIENHGTGGMTSFYAGAWRVFGETHLDEYATHCRTEEGGPVTTENLLDQLIDEYDWARKVVDARRKRLVLLRLMGWPVFGAGPPDLQFPPGPLNEATGAIPRTDKQWAEATKQVNAKMPPGPHAWWQAFNGECWRDVTKRPKGVPAARYV
jgi:hypothetical protein